MNPQALLLQRIGEGNLQAVASLTMQNPQDARELFETGLLEKWAEAMARGQDDRASLRLAGARQIAETLAAREGRIFRSIVSEMEGVAAGLPDWRRTAPLVNALRRYRAGRDSCAMSSFGNAVRELGEAEQELRSIHSSAEMTVILWRSWCRFRQKDLRGARAALEKLGQDPRLMDYPSLEARRQIYLAYLAEKEDAPTHAIAFYRRALSIFRALGEEQDVARTENDLAVLLESLGQSAEAWRYRYQALAWASRGSVGDVRRLYTAADTLEGAVFASLAQRLPEAALHLQSRLVFIAQHLPWPQETIVARLTRARIEVALGKQEAARRDFEESLNLLPRIYDGREKLVARLEVVRSEIGDAEGRVAALAAERFVPEHLDRQADFEFRRGDTGAGEKALERALDEVERRRLRVPPGVYRVSFLDQAQALYERMIGLQIHLGQPERALEVLERFHSRALLDQMREISAGPAADAVVPLRWQELCRRLPSHTVLLVYAVVEGRLVTWLVRPSGIWVSPHQPDWTTVSSWVTRLREPRLALQQRRQVLEDLYAELVAPWKSELQEGDRIIFVPTRDLYRFPFAALIDPVSGRFLIQDHAIGVAPSASEFVAAVERDRRAWARPPVNVLLVGDPNPSSRGQLPKLSALPGSAQEIQLLRGVYSGLDVRALTRARATPRHVFTALKEADIVHLAVHALEDFQNPTQSRLVLAASAGEPDGLFARDLLQARLPRTRLVVLAACGSHAGPVSDSEGSLSLAYSFLAAGVPAVLGSLSPIDDARTARLSVRFHQELLRGFDALAALRTAQLEQIAAHPVLSDWTWASFQVYGGVQARAPLTLAGSAPPFARKADCCGLSESVLERGGTVKRGAPRG